MRTVSGSLLNNVGNTPETARCLVQAVGRFSSPQRLNDSLADARRLTVSALRWSYLLTSTKKTRRVQDELNWLEFPGSNQALRPALKLLLNLD